MSIGDIRSRRLWPRTRVRLLALLCLGVIVAASGAMAKDLSGYRLTFDDEFNSFTSSPDGHSGWKTTFYFGGRTLSDNGEQQYYSDSSVGVNPFSLDNGALTITAAPGGNPSGLRYNSGLITTEGMFSQTYGYFEMRAELPQGAGMWPAFWLLPKDKSWPPEIDALEAFGAKNTHGEGGANQIHYGALPANASGGGGDWASVPSDIFSGYHTYGVDWTREAITYYFDGREIGKLKTPSDASKPMYLLANLAVGGKWPGSATGDTGRMKIDYIRAYSADPMAHAVAMQQVSSPDGADTMPDGAMAANGSNGPPPLRQLNPP